MQLMASPELVARITDAAFEKLKVEYSSEVYYKKLMEVYEGVV